MLASDADIIDSIRDPHENNNIVAKDFFDYAKDYATSFWKAKYPRLEPDEWDAIISQSNFKLISRLKKGLELNPDTKLTTYYTHVVGYAILDHLAARKKMAASPVESFDRPQFPEIDSKIERAEQMAIVNKWLHTIIDNPEQVRVMLLYAEGFSYKEILQKTSYESEGACRNALVKGKKKMAQFLLENPKVAKSLKKLLQRQ